MRILVLGASGMLGNAMLRVIAERTDWEVIGSLRGANQASYLTLPAAGELLYGVCADQYESLQSAFVRSRPDVVINCIGLVKQLADAYDPLQAIPINAILPHQLVKLCQQIGARLIHMSTDCVFSGKRGGYTESDTPDAEDLYGRSKLLGEIDVPCAITLRTSIIGHELQSNHGLVNWFLSQNERCLGYRRAIFSGLPTVILARAIRDYVIPRPDLYGLYHLAAEPISKYDLLKLIASVYKKNIEIIPDDKVVINRSLEGSRFQSATGFVAPSWPDMVKTMHLYR